MVQRGAIAIDLGGTFIKGAVVAADGQIVAKLERPTPQGGVVAVVNGVVGLVKELVREHPEMDAAGVGIGVPGLVDVSGERVVHAPNLHWCEPVPLKSMLEEALQLPVRMDNDANLAALGEHWLGAGKGFSSMALVTVGTGIGCGLILDGRLYRGAQGMAGELGHLVMVPDGPPCNCGRQGCLETLTAAPAIVRMMKEALGARAPEDLQARDVFERAAAGDPTVARVVAKAGHDLGWGLSFLVNLLNLEAIFLGGGVSRAGEALFGPVRQSIARYALKAPAEGVRVLGAALGNDAGALGAARMILQVPGET